MAKESTEYLEVTPLPGGLKEEQKGPPHRMLLPVKHILFMNDGDEGQAEIMLINGNALRVHESLEELSGQLGVKLLKPKPKGEAKGRLKLVDGN